MREQLLGYLLGALDQEEHQEIAELVKQRPSLETELNRLRRQLAPLADSKTPFAPPPNLAERTLAAIPPRRSPVRAARTARRMWATHDHRPAAERGWSLPDAIVAAAVLLAAVTIFLPAVQASRALARRQTCQNNLVHVGFALQSHAASDRDGRVPIMEASGPMSFPGMTLVMLKELGFVGPEATSICPGSPQAIRPFAKLPTIAEINAASPAELALMQSRACGSYAYPLGVVENGKVVGPRFQSRPDFGLMADSPRWTEDNEIRAVNHNGKGSNMLFEDGRVWFCRPDRDLQSSDDPFLNRRGRLAPGIDVDDAVLGGGQLVEVSLDTD